MDILMFNINIIVSCMQPSLPHRVPHAGTRREPTPSYTLGALSHIHRRPGVTHTDRVKESAKPEHQPGVEHVFVNMGTSGGEEDPTAPATSKRVTRRTKKNASQGIPPIEGDPSGDPSLVQPEGEDPVNTEQVNMTETLEERWERRLAELEAQRAADREEFERGRTKAVIGRKRALNLT